ncbi:MULTISPECIES: Maf family protein [Rhodanobacter]|uniref:7-methyl-GTP pyrophosphatase n=1 Tax=Rhodanobacter denitrificans TaxID=666685 RepID=M4NG19_9GAMM|nr:MULTISPECIES: Maf family protein [Rhodanobacter]AGG88588.1 MAF protein [Rhodanobacter denitrificans]UJJ58744.1 Maf family nucleotide pyrophosphatase [Rhodanobacter denitrificans]UJM87724.1 Maf family nucleotide pyrophosphatase [Rhodanobacter denitrificans]
MIAPRSTPRIVLGSTSHYRAELLRRLLPDFEQAAPGTDETPLPDEPPAARALRLAIAKAAAVARDYPDALVIGSDQVAALDGVVLDKPGSAERARTQLAASSGREVHFHTALCLLDTRDGRRHTHVDHTRVHFRELDAAAIARYVEREQPLDCAGSFKCEGLGISLFKAIDNRDPSALIGLPLIALAQLLRAAGVELP